MGEQYAVVREAIDLFGANQDDWELEQLLALLDARGRMRLIVEIGCDRGGTLWLWQQTGAEVIGVTLHTREDGSFSSHGANVIVGDSTDVLTQRRLVAALHGRQPDMVFIDGGHDARTARLDIQQAVDIAPAGVIVVHDISRRDDQPQIETWQAWRNVAGTCPTVEIIRRDGRTPGTGILFPAG